MTSVLCTADQSLHLAPPGIHGGVDSYTLCLRKWKRREPCREDSKFCAECVERWTNKLDTFVTSTLNLTSRNQTAGGKND